MAREGKEVESVPATPKGGAEVQSIPATPRDGGTPPIVSAPPSQLHSPSLTRSPLILGPATPRTPRTPMTPRTPRTPRFTPLASPIRKAIVNMRAYLEEVGHVTKLDPQDEWLPITESRSGNAYYSAFHTLSSGIGFQALVLPVAFTSLGWTWGLLSLTVVFFWQLYTLWLLTQLHESVPGTRYSRYLHLAEAVFGPKKAKLMTLFPIMYLSAGTCSALIIVGSTALKLFYQDVCGSTCGSMPLTAIEWYLVFTSLAVILSQLPNLNSIAGVSLIGAVTAVTYCTMIWVISVAKGRLAGVSYDATKASSTLVQVLDILNALGIIAFAFRGHNLVLEIQGTMPSTLKHPAHVPMWRGVKVAYLLIACGLLPMAVGGFWAYGNQIPSNGMLTALYQFHGRDTSSVLLGFTTLFVIINCITSFQIYAMPVFDNMESGYTSKKNRPCPWWVRSGFRVLFAAISLLISAAFPFLPDLSGLVGAIALPVTLAYPCFMWIVIKKPQRYSSSWYLNWGLGSFGMVLSVILTVGAVWRLLVTGFKLSFFKPQA